jgi:hypothetical protein
MLIFGILRILAAEIEPARRADSSQIRRQRARGMLTPVGNGAISAIFQNVTGASRA